MCKLLAQQAVLHRSRIWCDLWLAGCTAQSILQRLLPTKLRAVMSSLAVAVAVAVGPHVLLLQACAWQDFVLAYPTGMLHCSCIICLANRSADSCVCGCQVWQPTVLRECMPCCVLLSLHCAHILFGLLAHLPSWGIIALGLFGSL